MIFSFRKRFMNLAPSRPPAVATQNEAAPRTKILMELEVRNTEACVEAPTVRPKMMVTMSIKGLEAVFCKRFTTPDSLMILPKNSMPNSGRAVGLMKVVRMRPTMGNMIFSVLFTIQSLV